MLDATDADFGHWVAPAARDGVQTLGPDAVAGATPEQLGRLLTAVVRSDRFVEGSIAGAFESGLLSRISRRAATLLLTASSPVEAPRAGAPPGRMP